MTEATNLRQPSGAAARLGRDQLREPSDLEVAISVGQQLLDSDSLMSIREALRLLLRALGAEPVPASLSAPGGFPRSPEVFRGSPENPSAHRCPAAHPEDPTPCGGPVVVTVLDAQNAGADGCEHHAARLLASLDGGRVYALPDATEGAAIRVFKASAGLRPFCWYEDAPRTERSQLSLAEICRGGEGQ